MKLNKIKNLFSSLTILFCAAILLWMPSFANASALSPAIMEISAKRGEVIEQTFTIINSNIAEQTYYLEAIKFVSREDSGAPKFIPYDVDHSGLAEWISLFSNSVRVPARSKGDVSFKIAIPDDIASGGYYAAITVSEAPQEIVATNGASIEAKTATLLLLTVEGDTNEKAVLLDFSVTDKSTSLLSGVYEYRIQNQGNVHVSPSGVVKVTDIFGRVVSTSNANESGSRVLSGTTRSFDGSIGTEDKTGFFNALKQQTSQFVVGPVTVSLDLKYGSGDQVLNEEVVFWVIPWQLIISVLILLIVGLVIFRVIRRKGTNK